MRVAWGIIGFLGFLAQDMCILAQSGEVADVALQRAIKAWVECDECTEGQLEVLLSFGKRAVPVLEERVLKGPPQSELTAHESHNIEDYGTTKEYALDRPEADIEMTLAEFLEMSKDNYVAAQTIRAAEALARLQGVGAKNVIEEGIRRAKREDVKEVLSVMLQDLK